MTKTETAIHDGIITIKPKRASKTKVDILRKMMEVGLVVVVVLMVLHTGAEEEEEEEEVEEAEEAE